MVPGSTSQVCLSSSSIQASVVQWSVWVVANDWIGVPADAQTNSSACKADLKDMHGCHMRPEQSRAGRVPPANDALVAIAPVARASARTVFEYEDDSNCKSFQPSSFVFAFQPREQQRSCSALSFQRAAGARATGGPAETAIGRRAPGPNSAMHGPAGARFDCSRPTGRRWNGHAGVYGDEDASC